MQMVFPSYEFVFLFLPLVLGGLRLIQRFPGKSAFLRFSLFRGNEYQVQRLFLTACSLLFCLSFGFRNFGVLCFQASAGYYFFLLIRKHRGCRTERGIYIGAQTCVLLMLCFYKYVSPFFPVAISFTTFSLISFLADARRGEIDDCAFGDYLLFFFFFPKLLQGPIMRYTDFRAVVRRAASVKLTTEQFAQALFCFVLGLSKKVLLADNLAVAADYAFSAPENLLWMEALLATFTYTFQIYFDFSGYCDMGRAVSRMFGFDLPENFDRPYLAENIADFWRRWHRTLSQFLTRYVYIPLGGNRRGLHRTLCNTMIVFLLSGIWHGNSICFLIWGSLHGLLVCAVRLLKKPLPLPRIAKRLFTFLFVNFAWVFFRAGTLADAATMFGKILDKPWFKLHDRFIDAYLIRVLWYPLKLLGVSDVRTGGTVCLWLLLGLSALLVFTAPDTERLTEHFAKTLHYSSEAGSISPSRVRVSIGLTAILTAVLFLWCVLSFGEVSSFLYFQF